MQFFNKLAMIGAVAGAAFVSMTSAQLNSQTGCVFNANLEPVQCVLSWIFFTPDDPCSDGFINCYINTSTCEALVKGEGNTTVLDANTTIQASTPGLTLPLTLENPTVNTAGPIFEFNSTFYDFTDCQCGTGPNMTGATGYACSCPFDCTAFNNVAGK